MYENLNLRNLLYDLPIFSRQNLKIILYFVINYQIERYRKMLICLPKLLQFYSLIKYSIFQILQALRWHKSFGLVILYFTYRSPSSESAK